jgi:branched-chain amino acid transport system permease protein
VVLACAGAVLWASTAIHGLALRAAVQAMRDDDVRAEAIGVPTFRVQAAAVRDRPASRRRGRRADGQPAELREPERAALDAVGHADGDGDPGGVGTLWGGVLGAAALLLLEEGSPAGPSTGEFWTGWVLLAVVLFARQGLAG